jgi:hypothetical protein
VTPLPINVAMAFDTSFVPFAKESRRIRRNVRTDRSMKTL